MPNKKQQPLVTYATLQKLNAVGSAATPVMAPLDSWIKEPDPVGDLHRSLAMSKQDHQGTTFLGFDHDSIPASGSTSNRMADLERCYRIKEES